MNVVSVHSTSRARDYNLQGDISVTVYSINELTYL